MAEKVVKLSSDDLISSIGPELVKAVTSKYLGNIPHDIWVAAPDGSKEPVLVISTTLRTEVSLGKGTEIMRRIISDTKPAVLFYKEGRGDDWGTNGRVWFFPEECHGKVYVLIGCYLFDYDGGIFPFNDPKKYGYKQVINYEGSDSGIFERL